MEFTFDPSGFANFLARTEAVQAINRTGAFTQVVDHVIRSLIRVHRSGRIDDAIDILSELGNLRIRALATTLEQTFAPNGSDHDYWYAVIRAAGRSGDREIPKSFLSSRFTALQEAAVEALGDIGDHAAIEISNRLPAIPHCQVSFANSLGNWCQSWPQTDNPTSPVR